MARRKPETTQDDLGSLLHDGKFEGEEVKCEQPRYAPSP